LYDSFLQNVKDILTYCEFLRQPGRSSTLFVPLTASGSLSHQSNYLLIITYGGHAFYVSRVQTTCLEQPQ